MGAMSLVLSLKDTIQHSVGGAGTQRPYAICVNRIKFGAMSWQAVPEWRQSRDSVPYIHCVYCRMGTIAIDRPRSLSTHDEKGPSQRCME